MYALFWLQVFMYSTLAVITFIEQAVFVIESNSFPKAGIQAVLTAKRGITMCGVF